MDQTQYILNKKLVEFLLYSNQDCSLIVIDALITIGANVNYIDETNYNDTPILSVITKTSESNPETVKLLLDKGADVNYQNKYHETALMRTIKYGNFGIAKILLDYGANPYLLDYKNRNSIMIAKEFNVIPMLNIINLYDKKNQYDSNKIRLEIDNVVNMFVD